MLQAFVGETFDDVYPKILEELLTTGQLVSPRGKLTAEILFASISIANPRARILTNSARRMNPFYAVAELLWQLSGDPSTEFLKGYSRWWRTAEGEDWAIPSCYGAKIFREHEGQQSKFDQVVSCLLSDLSSRRAVISLIDPEIPICSESPMPCTATMQFLVRDGRLDLYVQMRSSDAFLGLPYDIFFFTFLQEFVATKVGTPLGKFVQSSASLHVYEQHFRRSEEIVSCPSTGNGIMASLPSSCDPCSVASNVLSEHPASDFERDLLRLLQGHRVCGAGSQGALRDITDTALRESALGFVGAGSGVRVS